MLELLVMDESLKAKKWQLECTSYGDLCHGHCLEGVS